MPVLFPALVRKFSSLLFVPYLKYHEGEESALGADVTDFFPYDTLQHFPRLHRVREAQTLAISPLCTRPAIHLQQIQTHEQVHGINTRSRELRDEMPV